jgi:YetA-like protein
LSDSLTTLFLSALHAVPSGPRRLEPLTVGMPFPPGVVHDPDALRLVDQSGHPLPLQARLLDAWPDGSARWVLLDFQVSTASGSGQASLRLALPGEKPTEFPRLAVSEEGDALVVDTGAARFRLKAGGPFPFDEVRSPSHVVLDPGRSGLRVTDAKGREKRLRVTAVTMEQSGPLRAVARLEGRIANVEEGRDLVLVARLHFYAGAPSVRFDLTLRNPARAAHPGGIWMLGAGGSVRFKEAGLTLALLQPASDRVAEVFCSVAGGAPLEQMATPFEVYQESSGGEYWKNHNHVNRDGVVPLSFRGYRLRSGGTERTGLRATPIVVLRDEDRELAISSRHFWENFPKAISAGRGELTLSLFPAQFPDFHELQGGEQKTHTLLVSFGPDRTGDVPLQWGREPLFAHTSPGWYASTGAVPYLTPAANDSSADYLFLVNQAIDGDTAFPLRRETIDEYGWRNFGDIYADHEAVSHTRNEPLVSHYNNQYDGIAGFACQYLRSADPRWWTQLDELARHVVDVDIYHTESDKAAFNGGLFWHTYHYADVGGATHRSYPRAPKVNGGGPGNEHNYTTGLMLHYFLTGESASREAVIGLARWVLEMEDGRRTVFRWLARGDTGLASVTAEASYHGPGRGGGNSINALLDAHRLTGDHSFLDKADQLVRRCIHPADNVAAREFLDPERRWSYTVFLRALGKYLEHKRELNELDAMYAYARASLLHYARWMAANERPYMDRPEILEYPNETWPALDMKKSEVFMLAARHAEGNERSRFLERARFFFEYSTGSLKTWPTRALARPLVLMLSHGFMWAWFEQHPDDAGMLSAEQAVADFGAPQVFTPQKIKAVRRAKAIAAAFATLLLLAVVAAMVTLWR